MGGPSALADERLDLLGERDRLRRCAAQEHDRRAGLGEVLEQGPNGRRADPGGDRENTAAGRALGREGAVGALDRDPGSSRQAGEREAVVAEVLDRDAQPVAVGQAGHRVRVSLPPQPADQKAPLQELPARQREAIKPPAAQHDRDDTRPLVDDLVHAQPVAQRAPQR